MMRSAQSGNDKAELIREGSRGERLPLPEKTLLTVQQRCSHNMMLYPTLHMGGGNFGRVGGVGGNTSTVGDIIKVHPWEQWEDVLKFGSCTIVGWSIENGSMPCRLMTKIQSLRFGAGPVKKCQNTGRASKYLWLVLYLTGIGSGE